MRTMHTKLTMILMIIGMAIGHAFAQPTLSRNEFYYIGDVIQMVNCDTTGLTVGPAGANVYWDMSGITSLGTNKTYYNVASSVVFLTANIVVTQPNGMRRYEQQNGLDTYVLGLEDTSTHNVTNYSGYHTSKRPFTYNDSYSDTFAMNSPSTSGYGRGFVAAKGDAYGTLKLPTGTYTNTLRIRKFQVETDTFGTAIISSTNISYLWFDTTHNAPLLRIDSMSSSLGGTSRKMMYLAAPASVAGIAPPAPSMSASLTDNKLMVMGAFDQGKEYEVCLINIAGGTMFRERFVANGDRRSFDVAAYLARGIYIVGVVQQDRPADRHTIKVLKQ